MQSNSKPWSCMGSGVVSGTVVVQPRRDESGHFNVITGAAIDRNPLFQHGRYSVIRTLGVGVYGTVVECHDQKHKCSVAIKLCKARPEFEMAAREEIRILRDLGGRCGTPALLRNFIHDGHICMAFSMLGENLKNVLQRDGPFKSDEALSISQQILTALDYAHSKGLIHTDVKTDNVLVHRFPGTSTPIVATLIDFGSALYEAERRPPAIGTQEYRPPEALLQCGYSNSVDIWAAACTIAEICSSRTLFPTTASRHLHLCCIQTVLGAPIPESLLRRARSLPDSRNPLAILPATGPDGFLPVPSDTSLSSSPSAAEYRQAVPLANAVPHTILVPLLGAMLAMEPGGRLTAADALRRVRELRGEPSASPPPTPHRTDASPVVDTPARRSLSNALAAVVHQEGGGGGSGTCTDAAVKVTSASSSSTVSSASEPSAASEPSSPLAYEAPRRPSQGPGELLVETAGSKVGGAASPSTASTASTVVNNWWVPTSAAPARPSGVASGGCGGGDGGGVPPTSAATTAANCSMRKARSSPHLSALMGPTSTDSGLTWPAEPASLCTPRRPLAPPPPPEPPRHYHQQAQASHSPYHAQAAPQQAGWYAPCLVRGSFGEPLPSGAWVRSDTFVRGSSMDPVPFSGGGWPPTCVGSDAGWSTAACGSGGGTLAAGSNGWLTPSPPWSQPVNSATMMMSGWHL